MNEKNKEIKASKFGQWKTTTFSKKGKGHDLALQTTKARIKQLTPKESSSLIVFGKSKKVTMIQVDVDMGTEATDLLVDYCQDNMTREDRAGWALVNLLTKLVSNKKS